VNRLSIRWRITLWNTAAFAMVLLGFGLAIYGLLRKTHYDQIDRRLQAEFEEISSAGDRVVNAGDRAAYVTDDQGTVVQRSARLSGPDQQGVARATASARFDTTYLPDAGHVRRLIAPWPSPASARTIVVVAGLEHVDEELWEVIRALLITAPITLLAAASIAYFLAYKALSPVDHLRQMTDEITAERLDRRLPVQNPGDELGLLAQTINSMIGRLEQSFGEIRRFTADASHELRTPVSIIRSEAELGLGLADCSDEARKRFESIVEECGRLANLTTQLLLLCREEAGLAQMTREPLSLATIVSDSVDARRSLAEAKGPILTLAVESDAKVSGNAERLRQVVENILENAVKYTPERGRIDVTLSRQDGDAVLSVRDNGIGIDPQDLPLIFDRFFRAAQGRPDAGGAGLGLSIVKSIVGAHQGRIEVQSQLGGGTLFRIFLPLAPAAAAKSSNAEGVLSGSNSV